MAYALCPSEFNADINPDWVQTSYGGSLGSQKTPSANGSCHMFLTPGVHYQNPGGTAAHGNTIDPEAVSGLFTRLGAVVTIKDVNDGTANTIMVGEIIPECNDHTTGWWDHNGMGTAHASTSVPLNNMTTCPNAKKVTHPGCTATNNWNFSWGFRSRHKGGANFLMADGSVHFISENIDYETYQRLGGRADRKPVDEF